MIVPAEALTARYRVAELRRWLKHDPDCKSLVLDMRSTCSCGMNDAYKSAQQSIDELADACSLPTSVQETP